jgi:hypothetical protein
MMSFRDAGNSLAGALDDLVGWLKLQPAPTILLFANFAVLCYAGAYGIPAALAHVQAGYERQTSSFLEADKEKTALARENAKASQSEFVRVLEEQRSDFLALLTAKSASFMPDVETKKETSNATNDSLPSR